MSDARNVGPTTKAPSDSKSQWIAAAILTAKTITAAAECAPFPYIKGVSGTVVILLETVEKVKQNREDLKELCDNTTEIVMLLHDQIQTHGNTVVKFKGLCEELESSLAAVIVAVQKLHDPSKGFRKRVKEFMVSSNIAAEIAGYQNQIQAVYFKLKLLIAVDTNLKVGEIHAVVTTPGFAVVPATQKINNCPRPSRIFQGRQTILAKMHRFFTPNSRKQLIYVLHGLGGSGKTQIALKFIQESSSSFSDIFFLDASTLDTIDSGFRDMAVSKSLGDSAQDALNWLQSKHEGWLLFFDNADDPVIDLNKFFPECDHGNIIITSRNPGLRVYGEHSPVSDIEKADAIALLLQSAAVETSTENVEIAAKIVEELHYLPLAIAQAGSFISKSEDLAGYLALYADNCARLLREKPDQSHDQYAWTVYTTWQISFDKLSKPAAKFLQLCSFLHYTGITEDIFSDASKYTGPVGLPSKDDLQEPLQFLSHFQEPTGEWSSLSFLDVTNEIKSYSLISFNAVTKLFTIHPLVHAWSRSTLFDEESSCLCINSILGMCISRITDYDITLAFPRLLPHLQALSSFEVDGDPDFRAAFWYIYFAAGKFQEAHDLIVQVVENYKLVFGEQHLATLEVMDRLGLTCHELGEYEKAKKLKIVVLEKRSKVLGEEHPDTLMTMGDLALTHSNLGDYERAKELETLVLQKRITSLGQDHPDTLMTMGNLALTHSNLGDYEKAKDLETLVLQKRTALLGQDHPDTLRAMGNLAGTHLKLGDFEKARGLEVTVLQKRTTILGQDHPDTLITTGNLALTHSHLGDYEKAKELETLVLQKRTTLLGQDHPETLKAIGNLALTYCNLGDYEKARGLGVTVLEKRTMLLGKDHPDTLMTMGNLALTYSNLGDYGKAKELETLVLQKRTTLLGQDHPETLRAMGNLAGTHLKLGDFEKARGLEVTVLQKQTTILGQDHPDTLVTVGNLALTHSHLGDYEKAKELQTLVLQKWTTLLGQDHPNTLLAMVNLALTHFNLGDYEKAKELETLVLQKRTTILGQDHPETLRVMENLARTHLKLGDLEKAKELEVTVLQKWTTLLGQDHPATLIAMGNLAFTYSNLGDSEKAQELEIVVLKKRRQLFGDGHPGSILAMRNLAHTYRKLQKLEEAEELDQLVKDSQKLV
ncbi:hypothetical protein B0H16DRAFT_151648 [Mycena metata]|uniref:DUF7779 domain-containing protein n=1 Tax=Mycena metata TaxID=1033252 RepID=A0AAD7I5R3_9AGAR|nr:hypothetical protein B0H16DRAFT_151648 [Mycena metata]